MNASLIFSNCHLINYNLDQHKRYYIQKIKYNVIMNKIMFVTTKQQTRTNTDQI